MKTLSSRCKPDENLEFYENLEFALQPQHETGTM